MLAALLIRSGFVSIIMGLQKIVNQNVGDFLNTLASQVVIHSRNPSTWEIKAEQDQLLKVTSLCREFEAV